MKPEIKIQRFSNLECGDAATLSHDATCRVVPKRGLVRALQIGALPQIHARGRNAFTLLEVMIAIFAFFIAVFAILALISQGLQNARLLQRPMVDAGMLASELSLTNKLVEGTDSGDFGDVYPGWTWTSATTEVLSNKLFEVDYVVQQPDSDRTEKMSILLYRPQSKAGSLDVGPGIK